MDELVQIAEAVVKSPLAGVALGAFLGFFGSSLDFRRTARRTEEGDTRRRLLEFLHSAERYATGVNGIALIYARAASGDPFDEPSARVWASAANDAHEQLARLRIEIHVLGPRWADSLVLDVINSARQVQVAVMAIQQRLSRPTGDDFIEQLRAFNDARGALQNEAIEQFGPHR